MTATVLVSVGSAGIAGLLIRHLVSDGWSVHATARSLAQEGAVRTTDVVLQP